MPDTIIAAVETNTIKLQCGQVLNLVPVSRFVASVFVERLGGQAFLDDPAILLQLQGDEKENAEAAANGLITYCLGWGVSDDAPGGGDRSDRIKWLREILHDEMEAMILVGAVLALSLEADSGP